MSSNCRQTIDDDIRNRIRPSLQWRRPHFFCLICFHSFYWHFRQPPTGWLKFESATFRLPFWLLEGRWWAHSIAHPWVPISSLLTHIDAFELISWLQKHFRTSARPPSRPTRTQWQLPLLKLELRRAAKTYQLVGHAKRYVTLPRPTVVFNIYHLFWTSPRTSVHLPTGATWTRQRYKKSYLCIAKTTAGI